MTTILRNGTGRDFVSAITQTPASGFPPLPFTTAPPMLDALTWTPTAAPRGARFSCPRTDHVARQRTAAAAPTMTRAVCRVLWSEIKTLVHSRRFRINRILHVSLLSLDCDRRIEITIHFPDRGCVGCR